MGRRFLCVFFAVFILLTGLFAGSIFAIDPYYHYHEPIAGLPLRLRVGQYQNSGVARNLDYDIQSRLMTLAGFPPTTVFSSTSFVTTVPPAITALSPMVTPGMMLAQAPIQTFFPI